MPRALPPTPPLSAGPTVRRTVACALALFGLTLLAYLPALGGGPLWDDAAHLTAPALQSHVGLWRIWFQLGATQQYYPVLHTAFWLEHRAWGDAVAGYHLLNLGLHATAACLFALTLARLRPGAEAPGRPRAIEWLAAAVFALHPVCVESVAWIAEQKNTLSLVFYLLAALAYLRFDRGGRWPWYAVAFGLFLLALLSKSVTATLPAALLLGLFWRRGRLSWRRDVLPLVPWFFVGAAIGLLTAWVEQNYIGARGQAYELNPLQRCFLAGRVVWFYLGKLLWPANLSFIYPRWQVGTTWPWSLGCLGLVATIGGLWRLRRWNRAPLVASLFFVGSLFPALGFFNVYPFVFSYVADHWQYLPCLGVIAFAIEGGGSLARRLIRRFGESRRRAVVVACAVAAMAGLAVLFTLTWRQCRVYRDVVTLYSDTLEKNPDCWMAHNNLGEHLSDTGALPEAIRHFRAAIRLRPDYSDAHNNLGNALSKLPGRSAEAIAEFETALRLEPTMAQAHNNLGCILINTPGRVDDGIAHLRTALQLHPDYAETHDSLGVALAKIPGRLPEAIAEYEAAVQLKPDYPEAWSNLGNALVAAGRPADAIAPLVRARQLRPNDPVIHYNLGTVLALAGRPAEAVGEFERALQLRPDDAAAQINLGNVLTQLGRGSEAVAHYRVALQLDPNSAEAHFNLGRALRNVGDGREAIAQFQAALRAAPQAAPIWSSLGSALLQAERASEAVAAYAEAVRLEPRAAPYRNNLGLALTGAGRFADAILQFRQALELAPGFADAHYNLAVALQQAGRSDEAAAEFAASGRARP